ncbi:bis(5'-nucleosyl)-tetraphosphatase (symmetrical) YqeK [Candidatus Xianfuyuplasma coldseepsis]|uniref:bis(5'-nucleosyl)-tetraphosphatase (symmetrical) n=1 Tax=Candidatus Xianfuyuplasma coldseepsis TaxID=2782163 RepID=A0A7L7KUF0_9MOLU|nr:bis(5'-nucleosyl)-tetraphosphatase (symmetrical) YqeK [Xianfuyuplasma coldseepsis]QMS85624.1 HD domain-containing protein [Xianfuyuplasma coldseepsis]
MIKRIIADLEVAYDHKPHRLDHVFGVRDIALKFGRQFNCNLEWLEIAALLHDITKYESEEFHRTMIKQYYDDAEMILNEYNTNILHAFSAAVVARTKYGITNEEILNAITHHTIGRPGMSIYEEILFLSDYIEPNRTYESCVRVRKIADHAFVKAIYVAMQDSINHHEKQQALVPNTAYQALQYYQHKLEEQE